MYNVHCMYSFVSFDTLHFHFQWIAVIKNNSVRKTQVHTCTCTYMYMYIAIVQLCVYLHVHVHVQCTFVYTLYFVK